MTFRTEHRNSARPAFLQSVALILLLASCSLERRQAGPSTLVRLEIPAVEDLSDVRAVDASLERSDLSSRYPAALSDFSCLLVRVSGDGITPMTDVPAEPSACSGGDRTRITLLAGASNIGILSDPVSLAGGSVALDVPVGSRRTFQLLGVVTSTGACPSTYAELQDAMGSSILSEVISGLTGEDALQAEVPVVLASSTVDVVGEASVTLTPAYSAATAKPVYCDGIGAPAIEEVGVSSVALASGEESVGEMQALASEVATPSVEATFSVRLNKAVSGFAALDLVPAAAGVEVVSVTEVSLRRFDVVVRLTPSRMSSAVLSSGSLLGVTLPAGSFTDLFGQANAAILDDLTEAFLSEGAEIWAAALPSPSPSPSPSSPSAPSGIALANGGYFTNDETPSILISGVTSADYVKLFTDASCSAASLVAAGYATSASVVLAPSESLSDGAHFFYASLVSSSGQESACSTAYASVTIDTAAPTLNVSVTDVGSGSSIANTVWNKVGVAVSGIDETSSSAGLSMLVDATGAATCAVDPSESAGWVAFSTWEHSVTLGSAFEVNSASGSLAPIVVWLKDQAGNIGCAAYQLLRRPLSVEPYYASFSKWNDYVAASSSPLSPGACTPTGPRTGCVHGGAVRKVALTEMTSCGQVSAYSDSIGVFDWTCSVPSTYPVLVGTLGEGHGLSDLVDFNAAGSNRWAANAVTVTRAADGATASSYSGEAWWSNPFSTATLTSGSPTTLSTEGEILLVGSSQYTGGIQVAASKVAVVIKSGTSLTYNGTGAALISVSGTAATPITFPWIEGPGTGESDDPTTNHLSLSPGLASGLGFYFVNFGVVRGLRSSGGGYGFRFVDTHALVLSDLAATSASTSGGTGYGHGFFFSGTGNSYVSATGLSASSNGGVGLRNVSALSNFEFTTLRLFSNMGSGMLISGSSSGTANSSGKFSDVIAANNGEHGIVITSSSAITPIHLYDVRAFNNSANGISLVAMSATEIASGVSVVNAVSAFNGATSPIYAGIVVSGTTTAVPNVKLVGVTSVNNHGAGLKLSNAAAPLVHNSIFMGNETYGIHAATVMNSVISQVGALKNGLGGYSIDTTTSVTGGQVRGVLLYDDASATACPQSSYTGLGIFSSGDACTGSGATQFQSVVTSNASPLVGVVDEDSENSGDVSAGYLVESSVDWSNFENEYRLFGPTTSYPGTYIPGTTGRCDPTVSQSCALHDLSLSDEAGDLLSASYTGIQSSVSAVQSCSGASGSLSNAVMSTNITGSYWHLNAVELMGDRSSAGVIVGDDDGLCESGEACVHTPNFGAYQGHGTLEDCTPAAGAYLSGVTMQAYPENGRTNVQP